MLVRRDFSFTVFGPRRSTGWICDSARNEMLLKARLQRDIRSLSIVHVPELFSSSNEVWCTMEKPLNQQSIMCERPMPNLSKLDFKKVGDPMEMTGKSFVPKSRRCGGGIGAANIRSVRRRILKA